MGGEGCLLSIFWVGNKPPEKSIGRQTKQRLPASFARSLSLAFALLVVLSLDMLWGGFVASFFQPSGRENGKVMPVLRVLQPTVLPVNIPSGIRLASHLMASSFSSSSSCGGRLCPPESGACASRIVVYLFAVTVAL